MKKMLVPFDEKNPAKQVRDFIYPEVTASGVHFTGIKRKKLWSKGMVVYTGADVSANDLFAKIVDQGKKIDSVEMFMKQLETYLAQLAEFKIGNIIEAEADGDSGFRLKKLADRPAGSLMGESKIP